MKAVFRKNIACALALFSLTFSTPSLYATTQSRAKTPAEPAVQESPQPEIVFTKDGFIEDLQKAIYGSGLNAAIDLFSSVPAEFENDKDLLIIKASLYISANKYGDAQKICTKLLATDSRNEDVLSLAATVAKAQNRTSDWNKYIKALLDLDQYNSDANIAMAQDYFSRKLYKQSRQYYTKALVRDSRNMDALFGLGQTSYYLEDDDKARSTFKKMIELDPDCAPAYSYLGKICAANEEYRAASQYALEAVVRDETNYDYIMDYGMYERYQGHFDEAAKAWTTAIGLEPDYFLAYAYRAGLYDEQDMFGEALDDYAMVVKTNPDYYYAYESMGILYLHEKQWKKAREAFMKCYEKNQNNISYPLMVTYCYYMEKDTPNAKKFSDSVLRKLNRNSLDYAMLRVFHDLAGEGPLPQKISALTSSNEKGKMYFYLALLYDMVGGIEASNKYYMEVVKLNCPMFFEYRIAEWRVGDIKNVKN